HRRLSPTTLPALLLLPMSIPFFFNDPAPTEIYTLSLHDALPISVSDGPFSLTNYTKGQGSTLKKNALFYGKKAKLNELDFKIIRSEEHTSELQSRGHLVCRLLLEKKKKKQKKQTPIIHRQSAHPS